MCEARHKLSIQLKAIRLKVVTTMFTCLYHINYSKQLTTLAVGIPYNSHNIIYYQVTLNCALFY